MCQLLPSLLSFLFFAVFSANAWAVRAPLVEIFCSNSAESVPQWEMLVQTLERGQLVDQTNVAPDKRKLFAECLEQHRAEFDEGEFYFGGKSLIESRISAQTNLVSDAQRNDLTVSLHGLVVRASEGAAGIPSPFDEEDRLARSEKYAHLWDGFLAGLKERMRQSRVDAKNLN